MKILIINPSRFSDGSWGPNANGHLFLLFSYLRSACPDAEIEVLDLEHHLGRPRSAREAKEFLADAKIALAQSGFDIVAISCWTSAHYLSSVAVAGICKALCPESIVVVGGYHPTAVPADFTAAGTPFDFVVTGDGESALEEIIKGARRPSGQCCVVQGHPVDMNFPLPWDEFQYFRAATTVPIWFSRGCPFSCRFCADRNKGWRPWTPQRCVEEIERVCLLLPNARVLSISDPLFAAHPGWRKEFLERVSRLDLDLSFWAETRADTFDPRDAELVARSRFRLDIGLDAVSPTLIKIMGKARHPDKYLRAFCELDDALNRHRIPHFVYLLLNYPGETTQMLNETVVWARAYYHGESEHWGLLSAQSYKYLPGTALTGWIAQQDASVGVYVHHKTWWEEFGRPRGEAASMVISSYEKASTGSAFAHLKALAAINALAQWSTVPDVRPDFREHDSALPDERLFREGRVRMSKDAHMATHSDGRIVLHHLTQSESRLCSVAESQWLRTDMTTVPPIGSSDLFRSGYLCVDLCTSNGERPGTTARILTDVGTLTARLYRAGVSDTARSFAELCRFGAFRNVRVARACPGLLVEIGLRPYQTKISSHVTPQAVRCQIARGTLFAHAGRPPHMFGISRARDGTCDGVAFGELVEGMDVLDRLIAHDIVRDVVVE